MTDPRSLVLVTGANGFIGSHLVEALLARGYRVRCMVRHTSNVAHIRGLPVDRVHADMRDPEALRAACEGVDLVCHAAALTRALDEATMMRVNAAGPEALARACIEANRPLRRFLLVSSQAAAGPSDGPADIVDESRPGRPVTWYGRSKLAAEQGLAKLSREAAGRLPLTIVRPSPVLGPRDRDFLAYFRLIRRGLNLQLGRQERRVSLIHVRDLVDLMVLALEDERAVGQTYFGTAFDASYRELGDAIARVMNKRTARLVVPVGLLAAMAPIATLQGRLARRPVLLNDQRLIDMRQRYWLCSGAKARRELGAEPRYDLMETVRDTAHWYREEGWL